MRLQYDIQGLRSICEQRLLDELTVFNAAELFVFSGIHGAAKLRPRAMNTITENLDRVEDTPGWKMIENDPKALALLLKLACN